MTASELTKELAKIHPPPWVFVGELREASGYNCSGQRMDAWAMHTFPSQGLLRRAFEIKVSRSDMVKELKNPDKRWKAYAVSHEFWFVTLPGVVGVAELARDDGLMVWDGEKFQIAKPARQRATMPARWDFVASLLRRRQP